MKLALVILLFIICGIISGAANASDFITFANTPLTREERIIKNIVVKNRANLSINIQGRCIEDCLKPIDGREDSIEISSARTSRPDEYMDMPTPKKDMGKYIGR